MNLNFPDIYTGILVLGLGLVILGFFFKFISKQKFEDKRISLEKIDNLTPSYEVSFQLGLSYLKKRLYDKAIFQFRNCLKVWNKDDSLSLGVLYNTIGFCYYKADQLTIAVYYYELAINLLPDYTSALNNLGLVFECQLKKQKALNIYKQVLIYDSMNSTAKERFVALNKLI